LPASHNRTRIPARSESDGFVHERTSEPSPGTTDRFETFDGLGLELVAKVESADDEALPEASVDTTPK
jgi:hypothetical protein